MKTRIQIAFGLAFLFFISSTTAFLFYDKLPVGADQALTNSLPSCTIALGGSFETTYAVQDDNLKLKLVADKTLAETAPQNSQYHFLVEDNPADKTSWDIIAEGNIAGQKLEFPVAQIEKVECGSAYHLDLEL